MDYIISSFLCLIALFIMFFLLAFVQKTKLKIKTWKEYFEFQMQLSKQNNCEHERWDAELSTRTLQCRKCLKRAYLYHYAEKLFK